MVEVSERRGENRCPSLQSVHRSLGDQTSPVVSGSNRWNLTPSPGRLSLKVSGGKTVGTQGEGNLKRRTSSKSTLILTETRKILVHIPPSSK